MDFVKWAIEVGGCEFIDCYARNGDTALDVFAEWLPGQDKIISMYGESLNDFFGYMWHMDVGCFIDPDEIHEMIRIDDE